MVMAQHGPEAAKRPGGDCDPQLGDVPFQTGKILGVFQIEIGISGERSRERRFPALPGAKNRGDGKYGHELG